MADAKDIAILTGSVVAAGFIGYSYGKGKLRLPNPGARRQRNAAVGDKDYHLRNVIVDQALVLRAMDWHGGQGSMVYSFASTGLENFVSPSMIDAAVEELERDLSKATGAERKELDDLIGELDSIARYSDEFKDDEGRDSGYATWLQDREENPTGFPMSAKMISKGPHEGMVMYRPKRGKQKTRPRVYIDPNDRDALRKMTEGTVASRQKVAGARKTAAAAKPKTAAAKAKPAAAKAKPAKKPRAAPKAKAKAKPAAPKKTAPVRRRGGKPAVKPTGKEKVTPAGKKAPPRQSNPGPSTLDLVRSLSF